MFDPRRTTSSDDRFIELALCYLDGRSSAEQLSQLNTELAADGFKRELFVDTCLHGKLLSELLGNSLSEAVPSDSEQTGRSPILGFLGDSMQQGVNLFSNQTFLSLLIATVVIGSLLGVLAILPAPTYERSRFNCAYNSSDDGSTTSGTGLRGVDKDGKFKFVARITGKHNCRWSDNYLPPLRYAHLGLGRELKLDAGLLEITYYNGAKVVLEGPVEFTVEEANACRLDVGKLTAKVSKRAAGFTVETPTSTIVDLGTEFGVEVAPDCGAKVYVFAGAVELQSAEGGAGFVVKERIEAGQAVRVDPQGKRTLLVGLPTPAQTEPIYEQYVKADSPIVYYRFEETGGTEAADSSGNSHDGTYYGNPSLGQTSAYQQLGNAVEFGGDYVDLTDAINGYEKFTIELWLNRGTDCSNIRSLVSRDGWSQGYVHTFLRNGSPYTLSVNGNDPTDAAFSYIFIAGRWHHLVLTYDKLGKVADLYVNGDHQQTISYTTTETADIAPLKIGAWLRDGHATPERYFYGLMDEVAIYGDVLGSDRIKAHYYAALFPNHMRWRGGFNARTTSSKSALAQPDGLVVRADPGDINRPKERRLTPH